MLENVVLYDYSGKRIVNKFINLDPTFFHLSPTTTLTSTDIEKQPYVNHAWIHACAFTIARNISQLPLQIIEQDTGKVVDDRWGILNLFKAPNQIMTQTTFMQILILHLLLMEKQEGLGGQAFILPSSTDSLSDKVNLQKGEIPKSLMVFNSLYVNPLVSKAQNNLSELMGWVFSVPNKPETKERYLPEEIIRIYFTNPYSYLKGLSMHRPALIPFLNDIKSDIYNNALYDNNATPAGILSSDSVLTKEQRREAIGSWNEEFGGASNAQKVAILPKGLKFQKIAMTQQEMQFQEAKNWSLEQIIASFGLNKIALGMYEKLNRATIVEGRRMLWQDTYLPIARIIVEAINSQWIKFIDPQIVLKFDTSNVEALRPDYTNRAKSAALMVKDLRLPPEMAMRINEIPFTDEDLQKYPWLLEMPVPLAPQITSIASEDNVSAGVRETTIQLKGLTDKERFSELFIERVLNPGEKAFQSKMERFFNGQRNRMQDKVDAWVKATKAIDANPEMFLLNLPDENKSLQKLFTPMVIDQLNRSKTQLEEELGELVAWAVRDETIDLYVANRKPEIMSINNTTFKKAGEKISAALTEANLLNETVQQAARRIKEAIKEIGELRKNQSKTIARTEIGIVTSRSRFDAFYAEGVEHWEWTTAMDERVRVDHELVNGTVIRVGESFPFVGIRYPLDTEGDLSQVINCRCVTVYADAPSAPLV